MIFYFQRKILQTICSWILLILIGQNCLTAQDINANNNSARKIDSLINLSGSNWNPNGPYDDNIDWLWQAEKISKSSLNWEKQVECLLILATVFTYKEDSQMYNRVVQNSYLVAKARLKDNHFYFLYIYSNLSDVSRKKRAYRKSIEYLEKGIKLCSDSDFYNLSWYYTKIASNYISLGDYAKAKQYLSNATSLDFEETVNDYYQKYHIHYIYGMLSKKTESFDLAIYNLKLSDEYLTAFYRDDYLNEQTNIWFELIDIYLSQGNYFEAKKHLEKIENTNFSEDKHIAGKYKISLAKFNYSKDQEITDNLIRLIEEGNILLQQVDAVELSLDLRLAQNLEFKGDIFKEHGHQESALNIFDQALNKLGYEHLINNASMVNNKAIVIRLLNKKLEIYLQQKNSDKTEEVESAILNLIRYLRIDNSSESTLDYWANENLDIIERIIEYNYKKGNILKVYTLIEENKSNNLAQDITESESLGYANIEREKIDEGAQLNANLAYGRKRIFELKHAEKIDSTKLNVWINEESKLQIELDSYLRNLEKEYPEYFKLKYELKEYGVKNTQDQLDKHSVVVEYFIGKEKGYITLISKKNIEIFEIENIDSLQEVSLDYYLSLSDKSNGDVEKNSKNLISQLGLDKLKEFNPDAKEIIIIADDFLNNIPFETLTDEEGSFLLNKYNIQYQYSARLWEMMKSRKTRKKIYDLVGYAFDNDQKIFADNRSCFDLENATNLKCAEKEVRSAREILDSKKVLEVKQNIQDLFAAANDTRILHLATHACLDQSESDYSRIFFQDTILTNQDLKTNDFSADLVVLSACETGFGKVVKGEGSMSLSKGFFHAGAKSTLVSLWPVDDCATSDLMGYFYKNLKSGQSKDEALRNAKSSYRQYANPEKTHPYYWAGFVIIGDCSPIWSDNNLIWYSILVFLGITLLLLLLKLYKTRKFSA